MCKIYCSAVVAAQSAGTYATFDDLRLGRILSFMDLSLRLVPMAISNALLYEPVRSSKLLGLKSGVAQKYTRLPISPTQTTSPVMYEDRQFSPFWIKLLKIEVDAALHLSVLQIPDHQVYENEQMINPRAKLRFMVKAALTLHSWISNLWNHLLLHAIR
ncbi:hypothetical protein YC2023_121765 [Brassica napus]